MIGQTLAHYEIVASLGKGGMGEVYRARDQKLGRDVAVKLLPPEFAKDPERIARFGREARTLAALQHGNIASIYGFEEVGEHRFLVMELVEGEDLATRLSRGPVALDDALGYAGQIGVALEDAHEKGILHRDLKPANVQLMADGMVKLLDFGLARALVPDSDPADIANSPTITAGMTQQGMVLGTAAYMSPEQARGRNVDRRTDIWAFGCVLFEMLSGSAPFQGETVTDVLAEVVKSEPEWDQLPDDTPAEVRTLLWRCLHKDPASRLRDIGEASFYLQPPDDALSRTMTGFVAPATAEPAPQKSRVPTLVTGLIAGLLIGGFAWMLRPSSSAPAAPMMRVSVPADGKHPFSVSLWTAVSISRDGSTLAWATTGRRSFAYSDASQIVYRRIGSREIHVLPGIETGGSAVFSRDGESILYYDFLLSKLMRVRLDGGNPTSVFDLAQGFAGGTFYDDETLYFIDQAGLRRLRLGTEEAETVASPADASGVVNLGMPLAVPEMGLVFFTNRARDGNNDEMIAVYDVENEEYRNLFAGTKFLGRVPGGRIAYLVGDTIYTQEFDRDELELVGPREAVQSDMNVSAVLAENGTLASFPDAGKGFWSARLVLVDEDGNVEPVVPGPLPGLRYPQLSPQADRVSFTAGPGGRGTIWVYDIVGNRPPINLTHTDHCVYSIWSPDGTHIAFERSTRGLVDGTTHIIPSDGSSLTPVQNHPGNLGHGGFGTQPAEWMSNGQLLVTLFAQPGTGEDIYTFSVGEDPVATPIVKTTFNEGNTCDLSPDEQWMAYVSNRSGRPEVWVQRFPDGAPQRITGEGAREPVWSRDGSRLFYQSQRAIWYVEVTPGGDGLTFSSPHLFFDGEFIPHQNLTPRMMDVHPDGRVLLVQTVADGSVPNDIELLVNWAANLDRDGD